MTSDDQRGLARPDGRDADGSEVIGQAPVTDDDHGHAPVNGFARPAQPQPVAWPQPAAPGVSSPQAEPQPIAPTQPITPVSPPTAPQQRLPYGPPAAEHADTAQNGRPLVEPVAAADPWGHPTGDPWIDVTPGGPTADTVGATPDSRGRRITGAVGLFAAGAVAGALVTGIFTGWGSNDASALSSTGQSQGQAGQPGVQPPGQGQAGQQPGSGRNGQGGLSGQNGQGGQGLGGSSGSDGEVRLVGALTAVTRSKVTVRSASGSGTYTIASSTRILRNGTQAEASDLQVGDVVLVHAFPSSGTDGVLELIYARGTSNGGGSGDSGATSGDDSTT
jgi:hypothetical protein